MDFDIAIVGAGLSAGPVIDELAKAETSLKIIIIERGPMAWQDVPWHSKSARTKVKRWWTSPDPGGASRLWYGQVSRFCSDDFYDPMKWPVPESIWAVAYNEVEEILKPYCADHLLKNTTPTNSPRRTFRNRLATFERFIFDQLQRQRIQAFSGLTCLGGHGWAESPVDPLTLADLSLPASHCHARNWVDRIERVCQNCPHITRVNGVWIKGIRPFYNSYRLHGYSSNTVPWEVSARRIVLAAGVLETVPILSSLPDIGDLLGKQFTLSTELTAYVSTTTSRVLDDDIKIGRFANISARYPFNEATASRGKVSFYDAKSFDTTARLSAKLSRIGLAADLVNQRDQLVLKISFKGRSETSTEKRIEPTVDGRVRIHYTPTFGDVDLITSVRQAVVDIVDRLPGAKLLAISDNVTGSDHTSAHFHGGAIFGIAPSDSVLDPDCRVWSHPCISVVDGSFMPGSGSTNSSLTVMANAWRVAQSLLRSH